jgi:hypothetical protein
MVAFGYEATGFGSNAVSVFEITPHGKCVWNAVIEAPYVGFLHDFAVTQRHIIFYAIPMLFDDAQLKSGGIHWSWDSTKPTYFGVLRRSGDGKDVQWIEGPTRSATHVMGAFSDGDKVYVDVEMSMSNPFPFVPMRDGSQWNPIAGSSHITRLSADLSRGRTRAATGSSRCIRTKAHCLGRTIATTRCHTVTGSCPVPAQSARATRVSIIRTARRRCTTRVPRPPSTSAVSPRAARPRPKALGISWRRASYRREWPLRPRDSRRGASGRRPGRGRQVADAGDRSDPRLVGARGSATVVVRLTVARAAARRNDRRGQFLREQNAYLLLEGEKGQNAEQQYGPEKRCDVPPRNLHGPRKFASIQQDQQG